MLHSCEHGSKSQKNISNILWNPCHKEYFEWKRGNTQYMNSAPNECIAALLSYVYYTVWWSFDTSGLPYSSCFCCDCGHHRSVIKKTGGKWCILDFIAMFPFMCFCHNANGVLINQNLNLSLKFILFSKDFPNKEDKGHHYIYIYYSSFDFFSWSSDVFNTFLMLFELAAVLIS